MRTYTFVSNQIKKETITFEGLIEKVKQGWAEPKFSFFEVLIEEGKQRRVRSILATSELGGGTN